MTTATLALLLTAPVILAAAIAIKLDSRGPVLCSHVRIGRNGVTFRMLELRTTAVTDTSAGAGRTGVRLTRVGRLLRATSIDELPQFWNVLRGDMGIVGPRPRCPEEASQGRDNGQRSMLTWPGMTGP